MSKQRKVLDSAVLKLLLESMTKPNLRAVIKAAERELEKRERRQAA